MAGVDVVGAISGTYYRMAFDRRAVMRDPAVAGVLTQEPVLRNRLLEMTKAAYLYGGWPAERDVWDRVTRSEVTSHAGDAVTSVRFGYSLAEGVSAKSGTIYPAIVDVLALPYSLAYTLAHTLNAVARLRRWPDRG